MMEEESSALRLAERLSMLRQQQGWSLDDLARQSEISRATLSRIERGETSPTAAVLGKLSSVYGLTMSRLLSEMAEETPEMIRHDQQNVWIDQQTGFHRRSISPPAQQYRAEFIEGRLQSGATINYDAPPTAGLEHHLWMLDGVLEYSLGTRQFHLEKGDCLRFRLFGSSSFYAPGPGEAHYTLVICRP